MFRRLRRTRLHAHLRDLVRENSVSVSDFIYPLFVVEGSGIKREVPSLPESIILSFLGFQITKILVAVKH